MRFEVFNRDQVVPDPVPDGAQVRVDESGRILFNRPAWVLLLMQSRPATPCEVVLAFDVQARTVAVQPLVGVDTPAGARWQVMTMRSVQWPRSVAAKVFIEHYLVAAGVYPAGLPRGPGPRMVTFAVGAPVARG